MASIDNHIWELYEVTSEYIEIKFDSTIDARTLVNANFRSESVV